jgi:uncharacterized DUF497 family protein
MFSWDAGKALKNNEKHGVPFEEAATIFGDPDALEWEDLEHLVPSAGGSVCVSRCPVAFCLSFTP